MNEEMLAKYVKALPGEMLGEYDAAAAGAAAGAKRAVSGGLGSGAGGGRRRFPVLGPVLVLAAAILVTAVGIIIARNAGSQKHKTDQPAATDYNIAVPTQLPPVTEAPEVTELPATETPAPTEEPVTAAPVTDVPVTEPTEQLTEAPTEVPTEQPTATPTEVPTEQPTEAPVTEVPTERPTATPAPTAVPTATPVPTERPAPEYPDAISFAHSEYTIDPGEPFSPQIIFEPANTINRDITWSLKEDLQSYGVALLDENQVRGWHPGSVTVVAAAGNGVTAECVLKVRGVTSLKLSETRLTMKPGDEIPLTVEIVAFESDASYTCQSDAPGVAVYENGKVKALSVGYATLTFRSTDGSRTNYCYVTVEGAYKPASERTQEDIRNHTTPAGIDGLHSYSVEFKSDKTTTVVFVYGCSASREYYGLVTAPTTFRPCIVAYRDGVPVDYSYTNVNGVAQFFLDPGEYTFESETIGGDYWAYYYRPEKCSVPKFERNSKSYVKTGIMFYERLEFPGTCTMRVVDEAGVPIPFATVRLIHGTDVDLTLTSDVNGYVTLLTLYYYFGLEYSQVLNVTVSAEGFREQTKYFTFNDKQNETISEWYSFVLKAQ